MTMSKDHIRQIPLFATLTERELEDVSRGCEPLTFRAGEHLIRQGDEPAGAFFLDRGAVDVFTALPGGGENLIATLGPGSLIGETAFLDDSRRTASVRAAEPTTATFLEQRFFQGSLAQRNESGLKIYRAVLGIFADRIDGMMSKIDELLGSGAEERRPEEAPTSRLGATSAADERCSFDYRAYLPVLPCFRFFRAKEIEAFTERTRVVELDPGEVLFPEHGPPSLAFVVVRGAVELGLVRGGIRHQLAILGPGKICGAEALLLGKPHGMRCAVREGAALLVVERAALEDMLSASAPLAVPLTYALGQSLLATFSSETRTLSRLSSLRRIAGKRPS